MDARATKTTPLTRADLAIIADFVEPNSKVLDVGCDKGELLEFLQREKNADARGIELSQEGVNICVAKGLPVIQGDADRDLAQYPDGSFDTVILSQTIQATHRPREVVEQLVRVGKRAIVSFPNFAYWRTRLYLAMFGQMPVTKDLPYTWYDTPNIHFCTIDDFRDMCDEINVTIEAQVALRRSGRRMRIRGPRLWNFYGKEAIFVLSK